jgi:peptidoglycan/xylan/chitin deacetylase (PgdA/CDA1 family)
MVTGKLSYTGHREQLSTADSVRVPILVYHSLAPREPGETRVQQEYDVTPEVFAAQMAILHENDITVIGLADLVDALEGQTVLPPRAVVITFDDGWETQHRHAFPVLRQLGYTATFFVFTHAIGSDDRFMTWDQLREMQRAGMTIGSHSRTHPTLTHIDSPSALREEVAGSRETLRAELASPVDYFAYPFGVTSAEVESAVRAAGYRAARAFPGGAWNSAADLWALRSVEVTESLEHFRRLVMPPITAALLGTKRSTR